MCSRRFPSSFSALAVLALLLPKVAPALNCALHFSGAADCVRVPDAAELDFSTPFTVEAWMRPSTEEFTTGFAFILSKNLDYTGWALLEILNTGYQPTLQVFNDDLDVVQEVASSAPAPHIWTHVAAVYGGGSMSIYIDGVLQHTVVATLPATANAVDLRIGCSLFGPGTYWKGDLDRIRLWKRALNGVEINAGIFHDPPPGDSDLVASWEFDNCSGTTATDNTGHGHDGTLGADAGTTAPQWFSIQATFPVLVSAFESGDFSSWDVVIP